MFERFTDRARRVIVMAQNDARDFGHWGIQPAHILLALCEEGEGVAARAMTSVGTDPLALRSAVESAFDVTVERKQVERLPFTPKAKKVLELSLREALQLGHSYIGTEHLLLGVLRLKNSDDPDDDDVFGLPVNRLRKAVLAAVSGSSGRNDRLSPALARAMDAGRSQAGHEAATTGHLLAAIVDDPQSQAARALASVGASPDAVRRALAEVPINDTSDAAPHVVIELRVAGRTIRVTDAAIAERLSSATPEEVVEALRRVGDEPPEDLAGPVTGVTS
jgi:ATP-dependent Clp protease ATP-binding subunit ClpA